MAKECIKGAPPKLGIQKPAHIRSRGRHGAGLRQVLHTTGGETDAIIGEVVHDIQILLDES